jgi:tetratricopeptide (TPR) repeat protein
MGFRLLPLLLAAAPVVTWANDACKGAAPYDCAVILIQQRQFPAAIDLLEKLTVESPRNLQALNLLGIALSAAGDLQKANTRLRQALQVDPAYLPALKNLSINQFVLGETSGAKAGLEAVLKNTPNDEVAHVYLGEIAFGAKQFAEAATHYEKGRAQTYRVILHYAECLRETGRKDDLLAVLGAIPAADAEKQFQAGLLLGQAGFALEAAPFFGRARVHAKDAFTAAYDQTLMLIRGSDYPGAIQLANELIAAGLRRAELYNLVSEAYLKTGQLEKACEMLRDAIQLEPAGEDNYVDLAGIYLDRADYERGLQVVDAGLKQLPDSYRLHLHRGLLLAQQGLAEASVHDFELASRLSPSQSLPYVGLGFAWMQSGDTTKAVEMLRVQVKSKPDDFMLPYILGIALTRSGTDTGGEAKAAFESSARLNPKFSRARAEMGKLLMQSGDVTGAIEQLETAIKLDPEDSTATYQLGQAYRRIGDGAKAQEMLARVVKLRHQKDDMDPNEDMKRLIRDGAASDQHAVAK